MESPINLLENVTTRVINPRQQGDGFPFFINGCVRPEFIPNHHVLTEARMENSISALEEIQKYHHATKHHLRQYARGPQFLDWDSQPDPFRRFLGAPLVPLRRLPPEGSGPRYGEVLAGNLPPASLDLDFVARLLFDSLALSAWKQANGAKWALRVNPSSGNLHPTEAYLLTGALPGLAGGIYHYAPKEHGLETRAEWDVDTWEKWSKGEPVLFLGLSSIHWREAWKYGERAFRYCQHDIGHALATISLAAASLGWHCRVVDGLDSASLTTALGLTGLNTGREAEHADCLVAITPAPLAESFALSPAAIAACAKLDWQGQANALSEEQLRWRRIERASEACQKPETPVENPRLAPPEVLPAPLQDFRGLVHQRRSAVSMDGQTTISETAFYRMLSALLPGQRPFTTLPWRPRAQVFLFVHRVEGLSPGMYALLRDPADLDTLREATQEGFRWQRPAGCPLPLYHLATGDARDLARGLSCHQEIASHGGFSVAMVARFQEPLETLGPWFYPRLFWECGAIGQMLYLEAEAAGIAGTGIGCFFDDEVHGVFGLSDSQFQSLYHFTVGGRVVDHRLTTLPPYEKLSGK